MPRGLLMRVLIDELKPGAYRDYLKKIYGEKYEIY